ncbi:hypothetical protein D9M68_819950 [compost metagenome]
MESRNCIACSKIFVPTNRKHRHCSGACVVRLHRLRKRLHLILDKTARKLDAEGLLKLSELITNENLTQKETTSLINVIYIGSHEPGHHRLLIANEYLAELEEKSKRENIPLTELLNEVLRKELENDE